MEISLKRMQDETEEVQVEEDESHLGADWLATLAGTGVTCTESGDSLLGPPDSDLQLLSQVQGRVLTVTPHDGAQRDTLYLCHLSRRQANSLKVQDFTYFPCWRQRKSSFQRITICFFCIGKNVTIIWCFSLCSCMIKPLIY